MPKKKETPDKGGLACVGMTLVVPAIYFMQQSLEKIDTSSIGTIAREQAIECCFDASVVACCGLLCIGAECCEDSHTD